MRARTAIGMCTYLMDGKGKGLRASGVRCLRSAGLVASYAGHTGQARPTRPGNGILLLLGGRTDHEWGAVGEWGVRADERARRRARASSVM